LFAPPVDEFELVVIDVTVPVDLPSGPQLLLCLHGELTVEGREGQVSAREGQAVVAGERDGSLIVRGTGRVVVGRSASASVEG
jgi:mannose-6-phosphate isomerase class I